MTSCDFSRILSETWLADLEYHASIASTNDRAAELAQVAASKLPMVVIADHQTAGRGRGAHRWWTGEGSLAFSLLLEADFQDQFHTTTPLLGLSAGLAIVDAVRPWLGDRELGIHWPNDVFVSHRKLAGILVEVLPDRKIIIGIGVNVNNSVKTAPAELHSTVATLFDLTGKRFDRATVLIALLNRLGHYLEQVRLSPELLAFAADAVCLQKKQELHLQWGKRILFGTCRGIDKSGALLLETTEGVQSFHSGTLLKLPWDE